MDFSFSDFWVQIHGLPLNKQNEINLKKPEPIFGSIVETDLLGSSGGGDA